MEENPATAIRIKIEEIALKLKESYIELNEIYDKICKVEEKLKNNGGKKCQTQ